MIEAIEKRRSFRKFTSAEVSEKDLREILRAAIYAPSGADRRPNYFIVVRNSETKKKLAKITKWSGFIARAPIVIVVCADMSKGKRWVEDGSIAATHMMLQATELGLGSCWVQVRKGSRDDGKDAEKIVCDILSIPDGYRVLCMLAVGKPGEKIKPHDDEDYKKEFVERVHEEKF